MGLVAELHLRPRRRGEGGGRRGGFVGVNGNWGTRMAGLRMWGEGSGPGGDNWVVLVAKYIGKRSNALWVSRLSTSCDLEAYFVTSSGHSYL